MIEIKEEEFHLFKQYLIQSCGIDIPLEKSYLFKTRLYNLLLNERAKNFSDLYYLIKRDETGFLEKRLMEFMTTNETSFFRDKHPFDALYHTIIPRIAAVKKNRSMFLEPGIKIWSAGCSSGQEPYSIALLLEKWNSENNGFKKEKIRIYATDISQEILSKARRGIYTEKELANGVSDLDRDRFFLKNAEGWQVKKEISEMISFEEMNLAFPFHTQYQFFDLIFCRNVVIYFSRELVQCIFEKFYNSMAEDGLLVLGSSESLYNLATKFKSELVGKSTFYVKGKPILR